MNRCWACYREFKDQKFLSQRISSLTLEVNEESVTIELCQNCVGLVRKAVLGVREEIKNGLLNVVTYDVV